MINRNIYLIDTGSVMHAAKHAMAKSALSNNDQHTFIIYGFLLKMCAILRNSHQDIVAYAFDSKSSVRQQFFNEYKAKRQEKTDEQKQLDELAYPQFEEIENFVLPTIGYRNIFKAKGFEADDIMSKLARKYKQDYITIVSNDKDMYQCITKTTVVMNPSNNNIVDEKLLMGMFSVSPKQWKRVKVYGGCTSDNVPGLPIPDSNLHIGEKTAIKYVLGSLPAHYKSYKAFIEPENKKIISRNKSLVILPHRKTPDFNLMPDSTLSVNGLTEVCKKYNFKSIIEDLDTFKKIFKLKLK